MTTLRRSVPFGLADAGLASLATFVAGGYAAAVFEERTMGVYALFFQAFMFGQMVSSQLVMVPNEIGVVEHPVDRRLSMMYHLHRLIVMPALLAALLVPVVAFATGSDAEDAIFWPLLLTATAVTSVSPIQTHVRRLLHLANRSWAAAAVSLVQVVVMAVILALGRWRGIPDVWLPFGSLALANLLSSAWGYGWGLHAARGGLRIPRPALRRLVGHGRWLLATGGTTSAAGLAVAVIVKALAGLEVLGQAESARILSQPVFVLAVGLSAVYGPRSMEAASQKSVAEARRLRRGFAAAVGAAGVVYAVVVAVPWPWSPLPGWFAGAYAVTGLLAVSVVGNLSQGLVFSRRSELMGAKLLKQLGTTELVGSFARLATAALAGVIGAFAVPLGLVVLNVVRSVRYRARTDEWYQGSVRSDPASLP